MEGTLRTILNTLHGNHLKMGLHKILKECLGQMNILLEVLEEIMKAGNIMNLNLQNQTLTFHMKIQMKCQEVVQKQGEIVQARCIDIMTQTGFR